MDKARYDVFLSHATPDKPVVEELARILRLQGIEPWLDIWNLIPGDPWQEAIEEALESCAACAVFIGPSGTGPWQNEEMRAAIERRVTGKGERFRVIPVLLPRSTRGEPSRLPSFLRNTGWVEFRETLDDERILHRLISGIRGVEPGPGPGGAVAEGARPYRGLEVFDVADAPFFFGREALTEWLLDKLRRVPNGSRFLAIFGPSGSGKSSLARAGLLAAIKRGEIPGSDSWPAAVFKPGDKPLETLAVHLAALGGFPSVLELLRDLAADKRALHLNARVALSGAPADRCLFVLVDQFEEVFTLCCDEAQRSAFIDNLLHAAMAAEGPTVVVLTLRADFYGRCAVYPDLAPAVSDRQTLVGPMTRDELRSAIERPAYLTGCELEGGLTELLLKEVESQPGCLPLLEYALLEIWQHREGRRLTATAYNEIHGVTGALEKRAEEVYAKLTEAEGEICRRVFLRLVQVDGQGRVTKQRLGLAELTPETEPDGKATQSIIANLTEARLLIAEAEGDKKRPTIELTHEALLTGWKRLKDWIEQDREALQTRRRLDEAVAEWLGNGRDPSFFYRGARLAQAEEWAGSHPVEASREAQGFLAASRTQQDQEAQRELAQARALAEEQRRRAEEQSRARLRLKKLTIAVAAMAIAFAATAVVAFWLRQESENQKRILVANELGRQSKAVLAKDPALSLLLSIAAVRRAEKAGQPHLPAAEESLRAALSGFRGSPLPTGKVRKVSLSADRQWLAVAGTDGVISLWHLTDGGPVKAASVAEQSSFHLAEIAVSPGGRWVLVSFTDSPSILFGVEQKTGSRPSRLKLPEEDWLANSDPFTPDGHWLLTRKGGRRIVRDLTLSSTPKVTTLINPNINPKIMAFSPDGRGGVWVGNVAQKAISLLEGNFQAPVGLLAFHGPWLVAQGGDDPPRALEVGRGATLVELEPTVLDAPVPGAVAVSLDGWRLSLDTPVRRLWRPRGPWGPRGPQPVPGSEKTTPFWVFSPDGRWLASATFDDHDKPLIGRPLVWQIREDGTVSPPISFSAKELPSPPLTALAFSPDGRWLASGDQDGRSRLWNLQHPQSEPRELTNHQQKVTALSFSYDGQLIATAGYEGNVYLRELDGNPATQDFQESPTARIGQSITALAFLPDGRLAIGDSSRGLRLWEIGQHEVELGVGQTDILSLTSNSQGDRLASLNAIWSLSSREPKPILLPKIGVDGPKNLTFTRDGHGLLTLIGDRLLRWELRTDKLLATACRAVGRNLTEKEWRTYIPSESYQQRETCPAFPKAFD